MLGHQAGRGGGRCGTAGITHTLVLRSDEVERALNAGHDEGPGAHILRLFLAPHHFSLLEAPELLDQSLVRPRIELLEAHQIDVLAPALLALLEEIVIDLARAHDDALDLV